MGGALRHARDLALNAGGPIWQARQLEPRRQRLNEGEVVRGNHFDSQRVSGSFDTTLGDDDHAVRVRRAIPRSRARQACPTTAAAMSSRPSATPSIARRTKPFSAPASNTRVGDATFGLTLGYFDRDDHIDSPGRRARCPRSFRRAAQRGRHRISRVTRATLTGTQKFSDLLSLAYGVDWLREQGTSDGTLDFGGGFVLPTSFDLTRTSWAPFAEVRLETQVGLSTQPGVRVDNPDDMSSVTSPRVRVAYDIRRQRASPSPAPGARRSNYPACTRSAIRWSAIRTSCRSAASRTSSSCRSNFSTARDAGAPRGSTANSATPSTSIRVRRPCW